MRVAWTSSLVVLLLTLSAAVSHGQPFVMSDFETAADLAQWEPTGWPTGSTLTRVASHATNGSYSCHLELPYPTDYPGMNLVNLPITDWSSYDVLRIDFDNPNSFAMVLHVEISDSVEGSSWQKRYYTERALIPGVRTIEIDLHNVPRNDGTGDVDTANIDRFLFYATGFDSTTNLYCDYVRLDTVQDDPDADAARDIYKFDFGTPDSPRWPDFFRVTDSDTYAASPGWGWSGGDWRGSYDYGGPDNLCRDFVCGDMWGSQFELSYRLDLPNDDYRVYVVARSGESHGMPVTDWQIWAEGVCEVDVPMDSSTFYSDDYYYRGLTDDYPIGQPYWERYVEPNFPAYTFATTVNDGHLDLQLVNTWVYLLIVYPTSLEAEMAPRIADWVADRKTQFESDFYVNSPEDLTFTPTPAETARGYAAWPVAALDPCCPDTLPPDPRPAVELSAAASQGERRAVNLAIRPLADLTNVSIEASDLSDGAGHTIASSEIECNHIRYLATPDTEFFGSGVLSWKPRLVQSDFPIEVRQQVTKQFWLALHVPLTTPSGTYTGTVTVHASSGDLAVPLSLEVWPFELDTPQEMAFGWYYMAPEDRYCFNTLWFPDMADAPDDMLRLDFAHMKKYGYNSIQFPTPGCSSINYTTGHVGTLDMSGLDRYVAAMHDTGFGGDWKGQVGTLSIANRILRSSSVTEFDANFDAAFKDVLARMVDWGNTSGVPLVMYLVDEPRESMIQSWNRNFADTMEYCNLANQVPGVVSTVTVMRDTQEGVDYTPLADNMDILQTHPSLNSDGLVQRAITQEKPIWWYNTAGDLQLVYGFYQYKIGDGCWNWHFDWLDGELWDPFPYSPFNNHWRYTYPSPDGPVPTLRYEAGSLGITDYRYAATLDRLSQEARATGLPDYVAWADQADALLESLVDDTPDYPTGTGNFAGIASGSDYLSDLDAALADYRRQIAQLIMALPGPIPGDECQVVDTSMPSSLEWDDTASASVTYQNLQATTWTPAGGHEMISANNTDRWGLTSLALGADVAPDATHTFDFSIVAPPLTTLSYSAATTPSDPGTVGTLACAWSMARNGSPLAGGLASEDIVISRFSDIQPELGQQASWARFWIEELAGRVPLVVGGYEDGTYRPQLRVARDAMAVFIARALKLPLGAYQGLFDDVPGPGDPDEQWAWPWIEALATAGIVQGYTPTEYRPWVLVERDTMAVYVARALVGGLNVPPGPPVGTFDDVPDADPGPAHWAYDAIEYCVANGIVQGYTPTEYRPDNPVDRGQMAVFVWRGFMMPTGVPVVLGGPAVTAVDPETAGYFGWSSRASGATADPGYAYVVFDAVRLDSNLTGPDSFFDVSFELQGLVHPSASRTASLTEGDITAAKSAAMASGVPYYAVSWDIPSGLPAGDYTLVVKVEDETGALHEIARQPSFTITP